MNHEKRESNNHEKHEKHEKNLYKKECYRLQGAVFDVYKVPTQKHK